MKAPKDLLMDALVELYQNGPTHRDLGICCHVQEYIENLCTEERAVEDLMEELFVRWPGFSGSLTYPVPGAEDEAPNEAWLGAEDMWTGEYGAKRWALAEFMLRTLAHGAA